MREMKESGVEGIGKIPLNWNVKRTKYVADAISKGNGITKEQVFEDGDVQCVRYGEIYSKYDNSFYETYSRTKIKEISSPKIIKHGDILFAGTGELIDEIGKNIVYLGKESCLAGGDIVILSHRQDARFLNYALNSTYAQKQKSEGKAKLKVVHITGTDIGNIRIALPPLTEQKKIADYLDGQCSEIDCVIKNIDKEIEILLDYKQSIITEAVTRGIDNEIKLKESGTPWCPFIPIHWEITNPKALFSQRFNRASIGERQLTASQEYGIVYQDEYMEMTGNRVVTVVKDFSILKHVEPGDFVISMRSFQGGLEYSELSGCISSAYVMLIPNKDRVYPPFYRWFFKSNKYINAIQSTSNLVRDGQAMRYANFIQVPLFIIPIEEQKNIADYLDAKVEKIDEVLKIKTQQIEVLKEYKKAIIYEYVTGKKEVPMF